MKNMNENIDPLRELADYIKPETPAPDFDSKIMSRLNAKLNPVSLPYKSPVSRLFVIGFTAFFVGILTYLSAFGARNPESSTMIKFRLPDLSPIYTLLSQLIEALNQNVSFKFLPIITFLILLLVILDSLVSKFLNEHRFKN